MTDADEDEVAGSGGRKLNAGRQRQLCRDLATGEKSKRQLAREYGVSHQYLTKFGRQRAPEIEAIRGRLDDEFAGLWIADKAARMAAYEADFELSAGNEEFGGHYEHIRVRSQILRAAAEELGQLPPRQTVTVMPVIHVLEGVDPDLLKLWSTVTGLTVRRSRYSGAGRRRFSCRARPGPARAVRAWRSCTR